MNSLEHDRLKGLLGVMVRRHSRTALTNAHTSGPAQGPHGPSSSHLVGQLIANEARRMDYSKTEYSEKEYSKNAAGADARLVDRLYRRFLLPGHSTVEAHADESALEEALS